MAGTNINIGERKRRQEIFFWGGARSRVKICYFLISEIVKLGLILTHLQGGQTGGKKIFGGNAATVDIVEAINQSRSRFHRVP